MALKLLSGKRWKDVIHSLFDKETRASVVYKETTVWADGYTPMSSALCDNVSYYSDIKFGKPVYYKRIWYRDWVDLECYGIKSDGEEHGDRLQEIIDRYATVPQKFDLPRGSILVNSEHNFRGHTYRGHGSDGVGATILRINGRKGPRSVRKMRMLDLQIASRTQDQTVGLLSPGSYPGTNTYKGATRYFSKGNDGDGLSIDEESLRKLIEPDFFVRDAPLPDGVYPNATWPQGSYWEIPSHPKVTRYAVQTSRAYSINPYDYNECYGLGVFGIFDVRNVVITGFGIGVNLYGDVNFKGDSEAPNGYIADRGYFEGVSVQGCTFGYLATGGDANKNRFVSCESRNIEVYGVCDNSLLGNYWDDHHSIDCGFQHYCVPTDSSFAIFVEPYGEAGNFTTGVNRPSRFGANTTVLGGPLASGYLLNGNAGGQYGSTQRKLIVNNLNVNERLGFGNGGFALYVTNFGGTLSGGGYSNNIFRFYNKGQAIEQAGRTRGKVPAGVAMRNAAFSGSVVGSVYDINSLYSNDGADDYNYQGIMFSPNDELINERYNGTNPKRWSCDQGGRRLPYNEGLTATCTNEYRGNYVLSGPTTLLEVGDYITLQGVAMRITSMASNTQFTTGQDVAGTNMAISYSYPSFRAEGQGRGTTQQRPTDLRPADAGWHYYDLTLNAVITWTGTGWKNAQNQSV
jgi:hypothetical protein